MNFLRIRNYKKTYIIIGIICILIFLGYIDLIMNLEYEKRYARTHNCIELLRNHFYPRLDTIQDFETLNDYSFVKLTQKYINDLLNEFYTDAAEFIIDPDELLCKTLQIHDLIKNALFHKVYSIKFIIPRRDLFDNSILVVMSYDAVMWKNLNYQIEFTDEQGVDYGGLRKEWLEELAKAIFKSDTGLFELVSETNNTYKPVEVKIVSNELLQKYRFVGRILAEILINNISINFPLADYIFGYILGQKLTMTDVKYLDEVLYNSLISLIESSDNNFLSEFSFNDINNDFYDVAQIRDKVVTKDNVRQYVALRMYSKYIGSVKKQLDALKYEFLNIINFHFGWKLDKTEFKIIICGDDFIDVEDWQAYTICYTNSCEEELAINIFWQVLREFTHNQRSKFLAFCTGTFKPPIEGFKKISGGKFKIRFQDRKDSMPIAHTCFNELILPICTDKKRMKQILEYCCEYNRGFGLS